MASGIRIESEVMRWLLLFLTIAAQAADVEWPVNGGPLNIRYTTLSQVSPVGSSRVDLQACKLEYSIVSPK